MVQTAAQKAALRSRKALNRADTSFQPRGLANKVAFEQMKEKFDAANRHTTVEADRVIKETTANVLEAIGQNTQPNPEQTQMAAVMASSSTSVKVLNSILSEGAMNAKEQRQTKLIYWHQVFQYTA